MQPQSNHPTDKTKHELDNLHIGDRFLPRRGAIHAAEEIVRVHDDMHRCVGEKRDYLQALRVLQPEEAHEHDGGVMEHMEEAERPLLTQQDHGIQQLIKFAQVVHIRPEEHGPHGTSPLGKAKHPLCAVPLPPQPPAAVHLSERRVQAAGEDGQGADRQHQIVQHGDKSQAQGLLPVAKYELERENGQQVQDHGRHREVP